MKSTRLMINYLCHSHVTNKKLPTVYWVSYDSVTKPKYALVRKTYRMYKQ